MDERFTMKYTERARHYSDLQRKLLTIKSQVRIETAVGRSICTPAVFARVMKFVHCVNICQCQPYIRVQRRFEILNPIEIYEPLSLSHNVVGGHTELNPPISVHGITTLIPLSFKCIFVWTCECSLRCPAELSRRNHNKSFMEPTSCNENCIAHPFACVGPRVCIEKVCD